MIGTCSWILALADTEGNEPENKGFNRKGTDDEGRESSEGGRGIIHTHVQNW